MTPDVHRVHLTLDLTRGAGGESAVRVRRVDVPVDFGTVWLVELPVLLEALLMEQDPSCYEQAVDRRDGFGL